MNCLRVGSIVMVGATALLLVACGDEQEGRPAAEAPPTADTAVVERGEGLTPRELRERAEPMTQEEAERRGVLDTTIYVEDMAEDTALDTMPEPRNNR